MWKWDNSDNKVCISLLQVNRAAKANCIHSLKRWQQCLPICGKKYRYMAKKKSRSHRSSLASAYQAGDLAAELWRFYGASLHSDVHDHREVMSSKIKWACADITVGLASLGLESFSSETLRMSQRIYESARLIFSWVKLHTSTLRRSGKTLIW